MSDRERVSLLIARLGEGDEAAREELVREHQRLVRYLAKRFAGKGEPIDDLEQVANIGLLKTIDRFDPERGVQFSTYATATIIGELKRHLRDKGWAMRIPRGLKQTSLLIGQLEQELSQRLGRSPSVAELAAEADLTEEDVIEALDAGRNYALASLDAPAGDEDDGRSRIDDVASEVDDLGLAERLGAVSEAIAALPARQRRILYLRFFEDLTQTEIAAEMGISQMHVSRLLARSFEAIRTRSQLDGESEA